MHASSTRDNTYERCWAGRRRGGPGAVLLLVALLGWTAVAAGLTGTVRLSWSPDEQLTEVDWPGTAGQEVLLELYLTVEVDAPIDSVGFFLRWAAEGAHGQVRLLGLSGVGDEEETAFALQGPSDAAEDGWFTPLEDAAIDGLLGRIVEPGEAGMKRYPLRLHVAARGGPRLRLQTYGVTASAEGEGRVLLGSPAIGTSKGWTLQFVPAVTEMRGIMNRSFLFSDLSLLGIDLDQVARLIFIDENGKRVSPKVVKSRQPERIDVRMANKAVSDGLCGLEFMNAGGLISHHCDAVLAKALDCRQPGDDNQGVIPGGRVWEECK